MSVDEVEPIETEAEEGNAVAPQGTHLASTQTVTHEYLTRCNHGGLYAQSMAFRNETRRAYRFDRYPCGVYNNKENVDAFSADRETAVRCVRKGKCPAGGALEIQLAGGSPIVKIKTSIPVLFILLDFIATWECYNWAHILLNDFLVGGAGRSSAKRIRKNRTLKNKVFLNDIEPNLRKYRKDFKRYYRLYRIWLCFRILIAVNCASYLFLQTWCQSAVFLLDCVANVIIATIYRLPSWPGSVSPYAGRKPNDD